MGQPVRLKRSNVPSKLPTLAQMEAGELAMNTADGRVLFSTGDVIKALANMSDLTWPSIGNKPTTLASFGITDALSTEMIGAASGVAGLDATGVVYAAQLPSYVDEALEYATESALPVTGSSGKMYVTVDTGKIYRWSGTRYVEISASPGSSDDVVEGVSNLYFTPGRAQAAVTSVSGNAGTATKLLTSRNLAVSGVATGSASFDGSSDATIILALANNLSLPGVGGVKVPVGTSADRIAEEGRIRYNSTTKAFEGYGNNAWQSMTSGLTLNNGMPAYIEATGGVLTSGASNTYAFAIKSNGTRNVYLNIQGDIVSSLQGYYMPRNALLRSVSFSGQNALAAAVTLDIKVGIGGGTTAKTYTVATGATHAEFADQSLQLAAGSMISVYMGSASNVTNPIVMLEISWRN